LTASEGGRYTRAPMSGKPNQGDAWQGMGVGWAVTGTMVSGIAVWGGIGYLVDRLAGTPKIFTAIGVLVGAAGSIYLIYLRYGRGEGAEH
jgi:F0F1-type ATP synthase assembly protein I